MAWLPMLFWANVLATTLKIAHKINGLVTVPLIDSLDITKNSVNGLNETVCQENGLATANQP